MGYLPAAAANTVVASHRFHSCATSGLLAEGSTAFMSFVLAAVGATVAALLELAVVPHLQVNGAHPHPVLVLGVVWVVAVGIESGFVWAFVGGLVLDVLAQRPLGSSAFALLVALGGAAIAARALARVRPLAPIPLTFVFSFVSSLVLLLVYGALSKPIPVADPIGILLPGAIYDTVLAALVGPLAVSISDRAAEQERPEW
jgi:rod shape-determining protein MreD